MSYWIGITGGIGSGKSVVSRILRLMDYPVYDCDSRATKLMLEDLEVVAALKSLFGNCVYDLDGALRRDYVAQKIFSDSSFLDRVNAIVHPAVLKDMYVWGRQQNSDFLFVESAILLTSFLHEHVDFVVSVLSDRKLRLERVKERSNLSVSQIEERMNVQVLDETLIDYSDFIIINDESCSLIEQVVLLVDTLIRNKNKEK